MRSACCLTVETHLVLLGVIDEELRGFTAVGQQTRGSQCSLQTGGPCNLVLHAWTACFQVSKGVVPAILIFHVHAEVWVKLLCLQAAQG